MTVPDDRPSLAGYDSVFLYRTREARRTRLWRRSKTMVDYMNALGTCQHCGEFKGWADGPPHVCKINPFLWNYHTAIVEKTKRPGSPEDRRFLALALCGEVGELANVIKKEWRGDSNPDFRVKLRDELGDVYAYLRLIALAYDENLDDILAEITVPKIKARWGNPPSRATATAHDDPGERPNTDEINNNSRSGTGDAG